MEYSSNNINADNGVNCASDTMPPAGYDWVDFSCTNWTTSSGKEVKINRIVCMEG